jgi:tripartite-type tricarboxylate transporter receptor subunit TctC
MSKIRIGALMLALMATPAAAQQDAAADWPNRTVKIIASVPAGGGVDIAARVIAERLRQKFGQAFIIENRPGAAGNVGAEAASAAEPDGYTLLAAQPSPLTINQLLYKKLHFDPTALVPVSIMTAVPNVLVVKTDLPARTLAEFTALAKANPGKFNFASQGIGTTPHLSGELFNKLAGTKLVHVPYRGTAQAVNDVVAGHIDVMFLELGSAYQLYTSGRARVLAISSPKRVAQMPDLPTFAEQGLPDFVSDTWNAIAAPPKTPPAIVAKLNAAIDEILRMPDVQAHFATINMQPMGGPPAALADLIKAENARWGDVIRSANITAQ